MKKNLDYISIAGLCVGFGAVVFGQILEGGNVGSLIQWTPFLIVIGGTMGAIMLQTRLPTFIHSLKLVKWVFMPPEIRQEHLIKEMVSLSNISRRYGLLELDSKVAGLGDPFFRKGLQMVVDGIEPKKIKEELDVEVSIFEANMHQAVKVWEGAGGYAPTIGILGAVLGLIHVMENLADPSRLGSGIAVAFVATIYGVGSANMLFLPMANKLKTIISQQVTLLEMTVEGLCSIANGENPRNIETKLEGYISA